MDFGVSLAHSKNNSPFSSRSSSPHNRNRSGSKNDSKNNNNSSNNSRNNSPIFTRKDTLKSEVEKNIMKEYDDYKIGYVCSSNRYKLNHFYENKKEPCFYVFHSMKSLYEATRGNKEGKTQKLYYYMIEYNKNNCIYTSEQIITNKVKFIKEIHWKILKKDISNKIINLDNINNNAQYISDCMITFEKKNIVSLNQECISFLFMIIVK